MGKLKWEDMKDFVFIEHSVLKNDESWAELDALLEDCFRAVAVIFCTEPGYTSAKSRILMSKHSSRIEARIDPSLAFQDAVIKEFQSMKGIGSFAIAGESFTEDFMKMFPNNAIALHEDGLTPKSRRSLEWTLSNFGKNMHKGKTWIISDTHFSHANIIKYCNRPFKSIEEMDDAIVKNWNSLVSDEDTVWHLGDFSFNGKENVEKFRKRLKGKMKIVLGNHDKRGMDFYYNAGFDAVYDQPVLVDDFFILSHGPVQWISNDMPFANFFGHVHDSPLYKTVTPRSFCACVERHGYHPVLWDEAVEAMKNEEAKLHA